MRQQIQKFGRALSGMVMPNIGAFIAWGFVTALFIPSGWWPNTQMARLVDPMLTYLLPLLIAYTAGRNVAGERGGVIGAIAAMGVIVGSDIPMFIGAMVMGPLGGYTIRWFDKLTQGRIKAGFEMLVSNFSIGILGMLLAILGYWVIGGAVTGLTLLVSNGVEVVIRHGLLPLVSLLVEPSKVLFLNNALNHGIFSPIGIEQARETGQSIMFLLETNPGPGLTVLPRIAGAIAAGIAARRDAGVTEPLNVIACENGVRATTQLREAVLKHLDEAQRDWCEQYVGFPDCSVDRIVPPVKSENPIDVVVERFFEWNVERAAFKGAVPEIPGMNPADNLIAYIERKLFTLNTGHAITAYLGRMKGYMTICQSISDEHIHTIVKAAMRESGRGLVALYGFDRDAHFAYIDKIIGRFRNPYLCDDVTRVGREPLRKLSAGDRLVRPILTARRYGIGTPDLLLGVGAALHYDNPEDVQSVEMRRLVEKEGVKAALARIASLPDTDPLLPLAAQAYDEVERIIAKIPEAQ